jgi:O-antigen ligase
VEAKEIVFTLVFLAGSAGLVAAVIAWPGLRRVYLCLFFLGAIKIVDVNYVSREIYRGWVRGFEISSLDMLVIGLLASVVAGWKRRRPRLLFPVFAAYLLFVAITTLSAAGAYVPLYASFGLLKLVRSLVVLWVISNAIRDEIDLKWIGVTVTAAVTFEGLVTMLDYLGGVYRARGTFDHPNTLGMYLNMYLPIIFAYLLNVRDRLRVPLILVFGLGAGTVVLTLSRGAWVSFFLALAIVTPLSFVLRLHPQKLIILGVMALLAIPPGVIAVDKMVRRIKEAPEASGEARHAFNDTAREMASDRFLGVGINNYSYGTEATIYSEPYEGGLDEGGLCHNLYYLILGETGWFGLGAFVLTLATAYVGIGRFIFFHRSEDLRSVWMVGWLAGLTTVIVQSSLEWALLQTTLSFSFFGLLGVAAAIPRMASGARVARWRVLVRHVPAPAFAVSQGVRP